MVSRQQRHSQLTRLAHMGLALAVIVQLFTSLVFVPASSSGSGDLFFKVHEYGGLIAFVFVLLFWLILTVRRIGTAPALLFPWFSRQQMVALLDDIKMHLKALVTLRLPAFDEHGALSSAVHGLGLLLMTVMATTGTIYYFVETGNADAGGLVAILLFVHTTLGNVVWAYLIGHAALAVIHHLTDNLRLSEMWSLRRN